MTSRCVSLLAVCLLVVSLNSYAGSGAIHEKKAYPVFQTGTTGAWGHSTHNRVSVGYVQSGRMNLAGVPLFLGMTLSHKCGITVHEDAFQRSLVFFYSMAGHGSACYGDHRAGIYPDTNGRNAAIACALSLLDQEPYEAAAQHLTMVVANSYKSFEAGPNKRSPGTLVRAPRRSSMSSDAACGRTFGT